MKKINITILLFLTFSLILIIAISGFNLSKPPVFDKQRAYDDVIHQLLFGARIPGSKAHEDTINWISTTLINYQWSVDIQQGEINGFEIKNIIAKRGGGTPWIIIGSHYDSRAQADKDSTAQGKLKPVPGANDGASSVAVLLELSRVLPRNIDFQIWLVFFDAEDISGMDLVLGSQYFVNSLNGQPDHVLILDMVGDKDLNIYMEKNSDPGLNQEIWGVAAESGYTQFIPIYKHRILDDHVPFVNAGISAIDIIDIDYPYWHTTQDTIDKISPESLDIVANVILKWFEKYHNLSRLRNLE
jgi:Zn-dependent M28 family amino/carboxypeptidase